MSTVDIVNQVGGNPANFLDIGGGANAEVMAGCARDHQQRPQGQEHLHQHLRRHHQGRRGRQRHRRGPRPGHHRRPHRHPPRRHQRRRRPGDPRRSTRATCSRARPRWWRPPRRLSPSPRKGAPSDGDLRRREHQGHLPGPHRLAGQLLRRPQRRVRHQGRGRHPSQEGRHRGQRRADLRQRRRGREGDRRHGVVHLHPGPRRAGRRDGGRRGRRRSSSCASPRASPPTTRPGSSTS